jgi:predicted PurR-regulated permease PerM
VSQPVPDPSQAPAPQVSVPLPRRRESEPYPPSGEAETRERRPGLTPITLFLTLLVAYVLIKVQLVLVLSLLALVFATVIERPVQLLEQRRFPRPLGILTVYLGLIAGLVLLFVALAPAIGDQADTFREDAPVQLGELRASWRDSSNALLNGPGQELLGRAIEVIEEPGSADVSVPQDAAIGLVTGIGGGFVGALTVLVIAFYYLMEKAELRRLVLLEIAPASRERVERVWDNVEAKVGDWLRGQLTLCLIIGVTATIGYGILDVRFWPLLGLWAGLTEIIPIVGPWLGGIPAVIIALTMSWQKALLVTGFIILLQLMENTVLVPRIMRGAVGLTPLTVFVAILAGTQFRGLIGALLAIPVAAAVQVLVTDYLDARRASRRGAGPPLPGWRWMRGPGGAAAAPPVDAGEVRRPPPAAEAPAAPRWTADLLARATGRGAAPPPDGEPERPGGPGEGNGSG